jgi:WbqC-like protein family
MLFSSNFLPCQAYFASILSQNEINIYISEEYRKQTYATRGYILGPHKVETIHVPTIKNKNNAEIKEIRISYTENWERNISKTFQNCYGNSPYFEHIFYLFENIFNKKHTFLVDLNSELLSICLKILKINKTICHKELSYFEIKDKIISFNSKNRLEIQKNYMPKTYFQNFGNKFEQNLSIVDLLFNLGPDGKLILEESLIHS